MSALNFTAYGTRWRVTVLDGEGEVAQGAVATVRRGLLFVSADGERRFLEYTTPPIPSWAELQAMSSHQLENLVRRAGDQPPD